jgi:hypothetical protein
MKTRGEQVICWIEEYCRVPLGTARGRMMHLSTAQRETIRKIYDAPNGPQNIPVTDDRELAAFLALVHLCSPEALENSDFHPAIVTDSFTVWNAADSPELRRVLKREGEAIICTALGTRFPWAAVQGTLQTISR